MDQNTHQMLLTLMNALVDHKIPFKALRVYDQDDVPHDCVAIPNAKQPGCYVFCEEDGYLLQYGFEAENKPALTELLLLIQNMLGIEKVLH